MKIIFLKSFQGKYQKGEIKEVNDGYALNFLIPKGIAKKATKNLIRQIELNEINKKEKTQKRIKQIARLKQKLSNLSIGIKLKADSKGNLFASVNKDMIIKRLEKKGIRGILEKNIIFIEKIKKIGTYNVEIKLSNNDIVYIKLIVQKED